MILPFFQYCGDLGVKLIDFYFPKNHKDDYTNEVFIKTQISNIDELKTVRSELLVD